MAYYDVRSGMDDKTLTPIVRSVNLMCALLDGITYEDLYEKPFWKPVSARLPTIGDPACALERMFMNAATLHIDLNTTPGGTAYPVGTLIATMLSSIRTDLMQNGVPRVHLNGLFLRKVATGGHVEDPHLKKVHDHVKALLNTSGTKLRHFCTPFMHKQATSTVGTTEWQNFIYACRTKTLKDLYATERKAVLGVAVKKACNAGILIDHGKPLIFTKTSKSGKKSQVRIMTPSGGNSRKCTGTTCGPSVPTDWCNTTSDGHCSSMSD